jgi:hypothetical protein
MVGQAGSIRDPALGSRGCFVTIRIDRPTPRTVIALTSPAAEPWRQHRICENEPNLASRMFTKDPLTPERPSSCRAFWRKQTQFISTNVHGTSAAMTRSSSCRAFWRKRTQFISTNVHGTSAAMTRSSSCRAFWRKRTQFISTNVHSGPIGSTRSRHAGHFGENEPNLSRRMFTARTPAREVVGSACLPRRTLRILLRPFHPARFRFPAAGAVPGELPARLIAQASSTDTIELCQKRGQSNASPGTEKCRFTTDPG